MGLLNGNSLVVAQRVVGAGQPVTTNITVPVVPANVSQSSSMSGGVQRINAATTINPPNTTQQETSIRDNKVSSGVTNEDRRQIDASGGGTQSVTVQFPVPAQPGTFVVPAIPVVK